MFLIILLMAICTVVAVSRADQAHFTVTADMRGNHTAFGDVCGAINDKVGGAGIFHVSPGDIDGTVQENRYVVNVYFGTDTIWYPVVGNHEVDNPGSGNADIAWIRQEYNNGDGGRDPLKIYTNQDGPPGCIETTYSWDNSATNSHFIALNEYWDGGTAAGSDEATTEPDIVPALQTWLEANLAANQDKAIFVFGHEPAFPQYRHFNECLDRDKVHRDAFWALLEQYNVVAYICGHTHYYSRHQEAGGDVWQIDVGNAGNDTYNDGLTFLDVVLLGHQVRFDVYRNRTGSWTLAESWTEPANCVPEPASAALLLLGLPAMIRRRRKK